MNTQLTNGWTLADAIRERDAAELEARCQGGGLGYNRTADYRAMEARLRVEMLEQKENEL